MERKLDIDDDIVKYDDSLVTYIQDLFIKRIVPANFLLAVHKHDLNVLTNRDISELRKKLDRCPNEDVNMDLLHILVCYDGWFKCILKVLNDPEIKQGHVAQAFEVLKRKHDLKWNQEHPKIDEIPPVSEPIVSQATDSATNEGYASDMPSTETNGVLEDSVVNRSLCSDSVGPFASRCKHKECSMTGGTGQCHILNIDLTADQNKDQHLSATDLPSLETNGVLEESVVNSSLCSVPVGALTDLSLSESKEWSMTGGKGMCYVCNIELTSEQHKDQHLTGRSHKKRLERNSLDGGTEVDTSPAEGGETVDDAERKDIKFCHACNLLLTSPEHAKQHYDGIKHRKKVDALKKNVTASKDISFSEGSVNTDDDEDGNALEINDPKFCHACDLALTSPEHAKQHYDGKNHRKKVDALNIKPALVSTVLPAVGDNEIYSLDASGKGCCKVCDVVFTSVQNAHDHLKGRNHEKKVSNK